jgi:uncharacterized protein (DUF736 family)
MVSNEIGRDVRNRRRVHGQPHQSAGHVVPRLGEAAAIAGSKPPRRSDMASIGSFKNVGGEFQGEIVTLSVQTKNVRIVLEPNRANDNAPSHRIYVGRAEIGAAPSKRTTAACKYLSVKLY